MYPCPSLRAPSLRSTWVMKLGCVTMRVFITGATGFVGSHIVEELVAAGHPVLGLTRSESGAARLTTLGAEPVRGDVSDLARLREAATGADAIIHTAFDHENPDPKAAAENDRKVIETLGAAHAGATGPLVITSGTGLVQSPTGDAVTEHDPHPTSAVVPRAATEEAAETLTGRGLDVRIVRLPQVHDTRRQGRLQWHVRIAQEKGRVAYVGAGTNRVPAAHISDVARLYRLVLENGQAGQRYHAVAEEGVPLRPIAEAIGARLGLPVESITTDAVADYFGPIAGPVPLDLPASGALTQQRLDWHPTGPTLLTDLAHAEYDAP